METKWHHLDAGAWHPWDTLVGHQQVVSAPRWVERVDKVPCWHSTPLTAGWSWEAPERPAPGDAGRWQRAPSILIWGVLVLVLVLLPHLMPSAPITTHNAASLHLCIKVLLWQHRPQSLPFVPGYARPGVQMKCEQLCQRSQFFFFCPLIIHNVRHQSSRRRQG